MEVWDTCTEATCGETVVALEVGNGELPTVPCLQLQELF